MSITETRPPGDAPAQFTERLDRDALLRRRDERFAPVVRVIRHYGEVKIKMLSTAVRERITRQNPRGDGYSYLNEMAQVASEGLVEPRMTAEELKSCGADFVLPVAEEVLELSNAFRKEDEADGEGEGEGDSSPFLRGSGSASGSPTA